MKFLINELNKFVNIENKSNKELSNIFTSLAYEVEEHYPANIINGVKFAKIIDCQPHPNSNKLNFCKTKINEEIIEVVCGATNVKKGLIVAHAIPGSQVGKLKLTSKEIRGIFSNGMILSIQEITGLDNSIIENNSNHKIYEFDDNIDFSKTPSEILGLNTEIFDLSILPDRQYAASYVSMAREIASYLDIEYKFNIENINRVGETNVEIILGEKATSIFVTNVILKKSKIPFEIKRVLYTAGIKPTETVEDIFAYALLITGASTYAIDKTNNIKLDGRKLNEFDIFNSNSLNTNSNELMLVTISSNIYANIVKEPNINSVFGLRNIKSTTTEAAELTSKYVIELLKKYDFLESASSTISLVNDLSKKIELTDEYLFGYIGKKFDLSEINKKLFLLGIEKEGSIYKIPSYRKDIIYKQDIIEEIIRMYGIENIEPSSHTLTSDDVTNEKHKNALVNITNELIKYGMFEVKTYQLVTEEQCKEFNIWNQEKFIKLNDKYTLEFNTLQTSLTSGLIEAYKLNHRNEKKDIRLFELSNVFHNEKPIYTLGLIHDEKINEDEPILATKELILKTLESLNININEIKFIDNNDVKIFNPFISSSIIYKEKIIGLIGEIHPSILRKNKFIRLDKIKTKLYYSEILLEEII